MNMYLQPSIISPQLWQRADLAVALLSSSEEFSDGSELELQLLGKLRGQGLR